MSDSFSPTPYSHTDKPEVEAIAHLESVFDASYIKSFIEKRTTTPNIDGYVELVDSEIPIGKLEVQIKSLSAGSKKFSCPLSLFAYAKKGTIQPVILICVDKTEQKIYWRHIKPADAASREDQKTLTIHFNEPEELLDKKGLYIGKWRGIIEGYRDGADLVSRLDTAAREMIDASALSPEVVKQLQILVDELNRLYDHEYLGIKNIKFRGVWKLGVGLRDHRPELIDLSLFGVKEGAIGSLIRAAKPHLPLHQQDGDYIIRYRGKNVLANDPKSLARKLVRHGLSDTIQKRALSIRPSFLRAEYLISFIDKYLFCLGLPAKDSYTTDELTYALNEYLPRWCSIGLAAVTYYPPHLKQIDPMMIRMLLSRDIKPDIQKAIAAQQPLSGNLMGGIFLSHRVAYDLVEDCRKNGVQTIDRIYKKPAPVNHGRFIWSPYTDEQVLFNLRKVLLNLDSVYNEFLRLNDLDPSKLLLYPSGEYPQFDKLVCLYYSSPAGVPSVEEYYLKHKTGAPKGDRVEVLLKKDAVMTDAWDEIVFDGEKYSVPRRGAGAGSYLFEDTPMLNLIYHRLDLAVHEAL